MRWRKYFLRWSAYALSVGVASLAASAGADEGGTSWVLGLQAQADERSSDSVLGTFDWGVTPKTWLTFAAGRSRSPADRADVQADTLLVAVDHRFDAIGLAFEAEQWGDPAALETVDLKTTLYFVPERWRIGVSYETRDLEIPFMLTGPLGGTLAGTAEVSAHSYGVDVRVSPAERWQLYFGAAEYSYARNLALLPRIDRLNLLSASSLTLANGLLSDQRSLGIERRFDRLSFTMRFATDHSAVDGSKFDTVDAALLFPVGARIDVEVNIGNGRSSLAEAGLYGGVLFLFYGG